MTSKVLQIALRIALIKEEFVEKDILEAVMLLESVGETSALLSYLAGRKIPPIKPMRSQDSKKPSRKQISSPVILDLKKKDPEKYKLLSNLEYLLRSDSILPKAEDLNQFAKHISNGLISEFSRQNTIEKLMITLAEKNLQDIEKIFQEIVSSSESQGDEYQQLASFILSGKKPRGHHGLAPFSQDPITDLDPPIDTEL
jgi:hypothetical protein